MSTTVQEASQRWIAEGKAYKNALNDWLDIIYIDKKQPETDCPEETRKDMSDYVLEQIVAYNKNGQQEQLRQLFPPDVDPIRWENQAHPVHQVTILPDNRLIATVDGPEVPEVYIINNNDITLQEGVFAYGRSYDKKYFAKVYDDKITISEGWNGPVITTLYAPKDYGEAYNKKHHDIEFGLHKLSLLYWGVTQVVVFPSGKRIGLASGAGIFIIDENGSQFIQTEENYTIDEDEDFTFSFDYAHIDVSPDGKYIVAGTQSSIHLIMEEKNGEWTTTATVEPRASYPNLAMFNYDIEDTDEENGGPQLLLCSCHFSRSASLSLPIKNIKEGFHASGYDADTTLNYPDLKNWIFAAGRYSWGYGLGDNNGYIWFKDYNGWQNGYLHIGGTVMSIDYSEDRGKMAVASYSGHITIYNCDGTEFADGLFRDENNKYEKRPDEYAITNSCYVDVKRYLFLRDSGPVIW